MTRTIRHNPSPREQGSVYILVLGASLLVAAIGVSSLMANRVDRKTVNTAADMIQARELARTAIDGGLWIVKHNPSDWRSTIAGGGVIDIAFAGGKFSLFASDPADGDVVNNNTDPVILIGDGRQGDARYLLRVTLNGDGSVRGGTWRRVVE